MGEVQRLENDLEESVETSKVVVWAKNKSMSPRSVAGSRDARVENIQCVNDGEYVSD